MQLIRNTILASALFATTTACSSGVDDAEPEPDPATAEEEGTDDLAEPDLYDDATAEEEVAVAEPEMTCPENAFCDGPLIVSADRVNLVPYRNIHSLSGTFTVANRSQEDLRIILLRERPKAVLDTGIDGEARKKASGLEICNQAEGSDCFAMNPKQFRRLGAGDSPTKINAQMEIFAQPNQMPALRNARAATVSFQLFTVAADGQQRIHQVSLADVPVNNQLAE